MVKLNINLRDRGYPIFISHDFSGFGRLCAGAGLTGRMMIVSDGNVEKHYYRACQEELARTGSEIFYHVIDPGEKSKNLDTVADIYRKLVSFNFDRKSVIVALGGGVVGDIAGFAAATYMRGIRYIQVPTSLIAQADSSIGGKTGVDFEGNKNMIGAFYQPSLVYINVNTLRTLPLREMKSGIAEVIKHGLIRDAEFFEYIDNNIDKIYGFDENTLMYVTKMNCTIKGDVVQQDERESGLRAILNFGHTIGHAVESVSGFSLSHGECVSMGIAGAYKIALKMGMVDKTDADRVERALGKAGLPVKIPKMDIDEILGRMFHDKKVKEGRLNFVLPKGIGEVLCCAISDENIVKDVLREMM